MQILRTSRHQIFRLIKSGALTAYKEDYKGRGRYVLDRAPVLARAAQRSERETLGVSVDEAARILGVSHKFVQDRAASGEFGIIDKRGNGRGGGNGYFILRADVEAFLAAREESEGQFGVLRQEITLATREYRCGLDDLSVGGERDPYRLDTPAEHRNGQWFKEMVERFVPPDKTIHIRGLFYAIVSSGRIKLPNGTAFVNNFDCYEFLKGAAEPARWLGYVPFERLHDGRNDAPQIFLPECYGSDYIHFGCLLSDIEIPSLDDAMPSFTGGARMAKQPFRICMIGEKSSLQDVLAPIAKRVGAELILSTGDPSNTLLSGIEQRAADDGRPLVVLYFSDFDPSGYNMPPSVARKLQALRMVRGHDALQVQVHAVALNYEQVSRLDLPSTPLKDSEQRADKWRNAWNHEQTEIDALAQLQPEVLRQIAGDAIEPFYDKTLVGRYWSAALRYDRQVKTELQSSPEYQQVKAKIEARLESVKKAIDKLKAAQEDGTQRLQMTPVAQFESPEPEISVAAPEPLFTTEDGFAAATIKLKRRQRYEQE